MWRLGRFPALFGNDDQRMGFASVVAAFLAESFGLRAWDAPGIDEGIDDLVQRQTMFLLVGAGVSVHETRLYR
jgi:hypothetical protein